MKDETNEVGKWPSVRLETRLTADDHFEQIDTQFPPTNTKLQKFSISGPKSLSLTSSPAAEPAYVSYTAQHVGSRVAFEHRFEEKTLVTGYSSVKLWVQAMNHPDADLYVALQKIDASGNEVLFYHSTQKIEAPSTLGWLRTSHRELDAEKSFPGRPYHTHARRQWLRPRDIVEVEVELWPQSTVWEAGETLRLAVQGGTFTNPDNPTQAKGPVHGFGEVKIWYGGEYDSALLLPVQEKSS